MNKMDGISSAPGIRSILFYPVILSKILKNHSDAMLHV
jgi:hypothetical protein